jgi:hypothetical protein
VARSQRPPRPLLIAVVLVVHVLVASLTWRDLGRRSDEQVRGPKAIWRLASAANTGGSVVYWLFGRR